MSQTHILIASALFAKPKQKLRNSAVIIGAILPDLAIYVLFAWSKINAIPEHRVWNELYWQEPWQSFTAAGNSIPLYLTLLIFGVVALRHAPTTFKIGLTLAFIALAALSHIAGDLPFHVKDAHRHLWPLSDWKFISPVSYWDPAHHGRQFAVVETLIGAFLCFLLFKRFHNTVIRVLLVILFTAYIAVPIYFMMQLGGS